MGTRKLKTRDEIDSTYKWNIEAMYKDAEAWNSDIDEIMAKTEAFSGRQGHVADSALSLADALKEKAAIWQKLERAYVYARMKLDENNGDPTQQAMHDKVNMVIAKVSAAMSFMTPEMVEAGEDTLRKYLKEEPALSAYRFMIEDLIREQQHVLSSAEEKILAQVSEVTDASGTIFTMLNNADLKFGTITDTNGDTVEVTHGNYISFMQSHDREVRKAAYTTVYESYKGLINTIATAYSYNVKTDVVGARIRKYDSSRASALSGGNIPESVYDNLVSVVNENLPALHKYIALRKKLLGVDELKMYDVYVPVVELPKREVTFKEAVSIMNEGLAPMGQAYLDQVNKGISQGWIDVMENEGKTSGAYSFGSYDSYPYILMNFDSTLQDVFTLVHEMGHSMNSYYTRRYEPFAYGDHSIFTAEVASTVNESLLMKYLLNKETDKDMRRYLLNMYLEEFRTTLFRQTMFAEFEATAHKYVEDGGSLTADWLCSEYDKLNTRYFGEALAPDDYIRYEWARIPHFYRAFYVYQYATGYSAATAISKKILEEGAPARDAYLDFLKRGSSDYPVELLKIAGVDMSSKEPIEMAMTTFSALVDEFEKSFE